MTQPDPRALIEAATPLPWRIDRAPDGHTYGSIVAECAGSFVWAKGNGNDFGDEEIAALIGSRDAALIVYAVNNLPALLDVAEALERLLVRLDEVYAAHEFQAVWVSAQNHLGPYVGPKWSDEQDAAREALARLKESR